MSYILEALRRAEVERQRGAVPGLHAQPLQGALADAAAAGPNDAGRRWRWPLAIGLLAVLLGLAAGLGWWLKPAPEGVRLAVKPALAPMRTDPPTQPAAVTAPEPVPAPVPVLPPVPTSVPAPVQAPLKTPLQTPMQTPPVGAPTVQALPVKPKMPAAPTPPVPPTPAAVPTAAPKAAPPAALARPVPLLPAQPPAAEARLPTLAELPDALRREVQPLSLGGLVYAEQPALRIAIVNGQVFHEGDKPLPDLLVQQIRPKSVVFGFRGQRFELAQ